nr:hypothetical protein Iba_chr03aCG1700 [Ipomoea batatas]
MEGLMKKPKKLNGHCRTWRCNTKKQRQGIEENGMPIVALKLGDEIKTSPVDSFPPSLQLSFNQDQWCTEELQNPCFHGPEIVCNFRHHPLLLGPDAEAVRPGLSDAEHEEQEPHNRPENQERNNPEAKNMRFEKETLYSRQNLRICSCPQFVARR